MTPGQQPDAGIEQRHGGDLAARQHVVADRNLLEPAALDHALVDAFEAAADDDAPGPVGQRRDPRLRQRRAARAHQQARPRVACAALASIAAARRRRASPCRARRRPACRRPCDACRSHDRGCRPPRATTVRRRAPCRRGSRRAGPGNISGKIVSTVARHMVKLRLACAKFLCCHHPRERMIPVITATEIWQRR